MTPTAVKYFDSRVVVLICLLCFIFGFFSGIVSAGMINERYVFFYESLNSDIYFRSFFFIFIVVVFTVWLSRFSMFGSVFICFLLLVWSFVSFFSISAMLRIFGAAFFSLSGIFEVLFTAALACVLIVFSARCMSASLKLFKLIKGRNDLSGFIFSGSRTDFGILVIVSVVCFCAVMIFS